MEMCDLNDREFKIAVLKKLNGLTNRNKINEQKEHFTRKNKPCLKKTTNRTSGA